LIRSYAALGINDPADWLNTHQSRYCIRFLEDHTVKQWPRDRARTPAQNRRVRWSAQGIGNCLQFHRRACFFTYRYRKCRIEEVFPTRYDGILVDRPIDFAGCEHRMVIGKICGFFPCRFVITGAYSVSINTNGEFGARRQALQTLLVASIDP